MFRAIKTLATTLPDAEAVATMLAEPEDDPNDLATLDKIWEEEAVTFGPGAATADGCGKVGDMLRRMGADQVPGRQGTSRPGDRANKGMAS